VTSPSDEQRATVVDAPAHDVREQISELAETLAKLAPKEPVTFMEVCGTHTMAVRRNGLPSLFPETVRLISGPGCPVCVTPVGYVDHALALAEQPDVTITTFGDLIRVPGSFSSLERARAQGASVEVVYSPLDALALARRRPDRQVVFLGVGFETTAPTAAAAIRQAAKEGLENFSVLGAHKVIPPAMELLASAPDLALDGFLCPGHVSTIIGTEAYRPIAEDFGLPCVVAGFEPLDVMQGLVMLTAQVRSGRSDVENQYRSVVRPEGNPRAMAVIEELFEPEDTTWRGLGTIPASGLKIREEFAHYDAARRFQVDLPQPVEPKGCLCGEILKGTRQPADCPLFGSRCTPRNPVGACMVSSEGTCAAHYRYQMVENS